MIVREVLVPASGPFVVDEARRNELGITARELEIADALGYTSIVMSALLVFFGIRSYREHAGGGRITFARGIAVGF